MSGTFNGRILVVDDDEKLRFVLRAHLSAVGFDVREAGTAEEAISEAFRFEPDVIVMDAGLPGMDGIEATQRLKADTRTKSISVIMLTARSIGAGFYGEVCYA